MTPRRKKRRVRFSSTVGKLLRSRTVWLALGQAVAASMALLSPEQVPVRWIGWIAIVKSGVDVFFRAITKEPIGKGQP